MGPNGQIKIDMAIEAFAPGQPEKAEMVWISNFMMYKIYLKMFIVLNVDKVGFDEVQSVRRKAKHLRGCKQNSDLYLQDTDA